MWKTNPESLRTKMFRGPKPQSPGLSLTEHRSNHLAPVPTPIPRVRRLNQGKALVLIRAANAFAAPHPVAVSAVTVVGVEVDSLEHLEEAATACRIATGVERAMHLAKTRRVANRIHRLLIPKHRCCPGRGNPTSHRVSQTSRHLQWEQMATPSRPSSGHMITKADQRGSVQPGTRSHNQSSVYPGTDPAICPSFIPRPEPK